MSNHSTQSALESNRAVATGVVQALRADLEALAAEWHKPIGSEITGPTKIACAKAMLAVLRRHLSRAAG